MVMQARTRRQGFPLVAGGSTRKQTHPKSCPPDDRSHLAADDKSPLRLPYRSGIHPVGLAEGSWSLR
ncbi:hypothetical protein FJTKL_06752 [Diaporthe vaccinii]|uniref:Uncharacterized protein n=1 Tax=Diaporthe vaccinii TaxID=105482 RepID=A0ABR4DPT6_9PEZI